MDQLRNGRETTAFARRLLCRTVTVVGGAAAGTAIAWFLSTGSAAAESPTDLLSDPAPVLSEAVTPLGDTLHTLAGRLAEAPSASIDRLADTAARVDVLPDAGLADAGLADVVEVVDTVTQGETVELPVQVPDLGLVHPDTTPAPAPTARTAVSLAVTGPGVDPEHTAASTPTERAYATGGPHRGSPEPATPDTPTRPAPFSPNVPTPGHTGHPGANPADSPGAAFPWLDRAPRPVRGLTASAAETTVSGRAGDQPGIAPD